MPELDPTPVNPAGATTEQLIADSIFLFSKEIYYWQDRIGSVSYETFNPRQYVTTNDPLATAKKVIEAVRAYNGHDKEKKYSYAEEYADAATSGKAATVQTDYGFEFEFGWKSRKIHTTYYEKDPDFDGYYVSFVYSKSDAGKKGVERGMKIYTLNNKQLQFTQTDYETLFDAVNNPSGSNQFRFIKYNGGVADTTDNITINSNSYTPNSVIHYSVGSTSGGNKFGYMVYKLFDKLADSQSDLDAAFAAFRNGGVKNVILDLRYNRGGYTITQDYVTNHLAPPGTSGTMYTCFYNTNLQANSYTLMKTRGNYNFAPTGGNVISFKIPGDAVAPTKLYIIVGTNTASSSELLINNLRQKYGTNDMVLIGDNNTYGKPVGFFPVDLFEKVTFWTVSFMTRNSKNDSVSYAGFEPRYKVYDGIDKSWGDKTEDCVAAALNLIDGATPVTSAIAQETISRSVSSNKISVMRKQRLMDNMLFTKSE